MVHVAGERAALERFAASVADVLTRGDADLVERGLGRLGQVDIALAGVLGGAGDILGHVHELLVLGSKVRLGAELDDGGLVAIDSHTDATLASGSIGARLHLALELLAQQVFGGLLVAAGLGECLLALHH